jgi:hypothetical protein
MSDKLIKNNPSPYDELCKALRDREESRIEHLKKDKRRLEVSSSRGSSMLVTSFYSLSYVVLAFYI